MRIRLLQGRSGIDLVLPEDRVSVIAAWDMMLARGTGRCVVHLAVQPTVTVAFDLFDARASHGVHLLVITPVRPGGCACAINAAINPGCGSRSPTTISSTTPSSDAWSAECSTSQRRWRRVRRYAPCEQLLDRLAEAIPLGLFQIDSARHIVYTHDRLHEIIGVERSPTVKAQLSTVVDEDRAALEDALDAVLRRGLPADIEVALKLPPIPEPRLCTMILRALSDDAGTVNGAIVCVADVTDRARMRDELKQRATYDQLTGCYNRASLMLALEADLARRHDRPERAVIFIDLDGFKRVNDTLGHAAGDELLAIAAEQLKRAIRDEDLVGRLGGDEFLVICPQITGLDAAIKLSQRLAAALTATVALAAGSSHLSASVGVAWSKGSRMTADELVAQADTAMYESKRLRAACHS